MARQPVSERLLHGSLLSASIILLFMHPGGLALLRKPLLTLAPWVGWTATGVVLAGFAFAWWARFHLGRLWSGKVTLKTGHRLVRSGPYGLTRHPIYTGLLLALVATAVVQDSVGALVGLGMIVGGLLLKIRQEERLLAGHSARPTPPIVPRCRRCFPGSGEPGRSRK